MSRRVLRHTARGVRELVGRSPIAARCRARLASAGREDGSAIVEFIVVGVALILPVFYLVVTLARLQAGTYAVAAAARESSRMFVTASNDSTATARSQAAARMAFADQGFEGAGTVQVLCSKSPCLTPDGVIDTVADLDVELPLIPSFLQGAVPSVVHLHSRHAEVVDRYRAR
ncbi:pilus assembly protein [Rudaeicoccus suwonensis]|uniref:TadE-like protein n=1 Tax=Rudaeicoccus suwonensis TaxID=657409 RepID=A0A561E1C3_9MICO|nr:pilus assembly protein [Rudaeicoccus suwonensis]TWE09426.1 hypothetical protein BKA23_3129 [Rudaeicoccus suwonensis]